MQLAASLLLLSFVPASAQIPKIVFSGGAQYPAGGFEGRAEFRVPMPPIPLMVNAPFYGQEKMEPTAGQSTAQTQLMRPTRHGQKVWRDSQGRIRIEQTFASGASQTKNVPTLVEIQDPVAGYTYIMDDVTRLVHRIKSPVVPQKNLEELVVHTVPASVAANSSLEDLGTQTMSGIRVHGTRRVFVFAAGTRGNSAAFTSSRDYWYSPDLNLIIRTINSDPRSGGDTESLSDLTCKEPDPAQFVVPLDYKLVDESAAFTIQWK
jgi:hypothetical protein